MALPPSVSLGGKRVFLGWSPVHGASEGALTPAERALHDRGKTPKRRMEFCAGRAAARMAVARLDPGLGAYDVLALESGTESGRPCLVPHRAIGVSIAHSGAWAVAAAAERGRVGVDLEQQELELGPAFLKEAFSPHELELWLALPPAAAAGASLAWAAKEAALKWFGVGLRAALQRVRVSPGLTSFHDGHWRVELEVFTAGAWPEAPTVPQRLEGLVRCEGALVLALVV